MENSHTSISGNKSKYIDESNPKIDLVKCHLNNSHCKKYLSEINQDFLDSENYRSNKEYNRAMEHLKSAFKNTFEKKENYCFRCADLFHSTLVQSLESIHEELQKLTTGFFRAKRYQPSLEMAENLLTEFKKQD